MSDIDVLVSEVGPRDGLQNAKQFMPTEFKKRWITAAAAAGLREIEAAVAVAEGPRRLVAHDLLGAAVHRRARGRMTGPAEP